MRFIQFPGSSKCCQEEVLVRMKVFREGRDRERCLGYYYYGGWVAGESGWYESFTIDETKASNHITSRCSGRSMTSFEIPH